MGIAARRYGAPLVLLPAVTLAVFLTELLRRHGYGSLRHPLGFAAAVLLLAAAVMAEWPLYAALWARAARFGLEQALRLDGLCHLPLLLPAVYFVPPVAQVRNIGTLLLASALGLMLGLRASAAIYPYRGRLGACFSRRLTTLGPILAVALLLRVSLIAANRFYVDEALYSHWGLLIASGRDLFLRSELVDKPPVFFYILALFFKLFGPGEAVARLPNIIASLAGIAIVYEMALDLFNRRTATLAALFLALSPYDIQFAPTVFVDPLMTALALGACLLALRGRYSWSGLALGLAIMTKPQGAVFLPLTLLFAGESLRRERWRRKLLPAVLGFAGGLGAVIGADLVWDLVIRRGSTTWMRAGVVHYGGMGLASPARFLPRLQGWLALAQYFTGSPVLNGLLLLGVPCLLACALWRRLRPGWAADWALALFGVFFLAVHTVLGLQVWDRYILSLAPIVAILLARVVLLPLDLLPKGEPVAWLRMGYGTLLALFLAVALALPAHTAQHYGFPIGGDHGAYQGIEQVAAYLKGNAPAHAIIYHQDLGWHYSYYLFGQPFDFYYYPSDRFVLDTANQFPQVEKYIVFPDWRSPASLQTLLQQGGWELHEVYRTYRPDGSVSFTVYRIERAGSS